MFKNARKVHIDGEVYHYVFGSGENRRKVIIQFPDGHKIQVKMRDFSAVMDVTAEEIDEFLNGWDRCTWYEEQSPERAGCKTVAITPGVIKKYIEHLLADTKGS